MALGENNFVKYQHMNNLLWPTTGQYTCFHICENSTGKNSLQHNGSWVCKTLAL